MAVFGEETLPLPIFNGMGDTDKVVSIGPKSLNEDLCGTLVNLFLSAEKEYRVREDLILIQQLTGKTAPVIAVATNPVPRHLYETSLDIFTAVGSETVDSPTLLSFFDDGTTRNVSWINCNSVTPSTIVQTVPSGYGGVKAFCQFKDRYYASNGSTKIYRISNFTTTPATPVTVTDLLVVTGGVDILITFRSRVFGIKKGRIYYTDLPAIGGYPEVWNSSTNFVDIPSVDYDVTCHQAYIYRDKMYLFTDKGIYSFNINGSPANWSIQLVSSGFPIFDRDSVCINKNIIFLTDQQSMVSFDGSTFKRISDNIRSFFYNNANGNVVWFNIYPWEDGVLLIRNHFNNFSTNYASPANFEVYYFNQVIWTEIQYSGSNHIEAIKAGANLQPYRGKIASSWIAYHSSVATTINVFFYDTGTWMGDITDTNHAGGTRLRKAISLWAPNPFIKDRAFKKWKFLDFYGYYNDVATLDMSFNGTAAVANDLGKPIIKVPITYGAPAGSAFINIYDEIFILGTVLKDPNAAGSFQRCPFIIRGMDLVYNKDNKDRDGMST